MTKGIIEEYKGRTLYRKHKGNILIMKNGKVTGYGTSVKKIKAMINANDARKDVEHDY